MFEAKLLNILNCAKEGTEAKKDVAKLLICLKFAIRHIAKEQRQISETLHQIKNKTDGQECSDFIKLACLRKYERDLKKIFELNNKHLAKIGELAIRALHYYESLGATDHELAQILNCNKKDLEEYRQMHRKFKKGVGFFVDAVMVYNVEHRSRKCDNVFIGDNPEETPFFSALLATMLYQMENNKEFVTKMQELVEDHFPEIRGEMYSLVKDPDGKVRLEKYYPPLKLVKSNYRLNVASKRKS
ncbi:hypothetical protein SAMN02745218_02792 [Desulfofundulus australicus DSM 11792]|jgi:hypothetical protein|uniref:Uncharacterized protein n=1 Tax=Desulfofundulus australicus DSM 11792 TaxID=1121425 RepID=A0A1M5DDN3_9FIRM|nr:hypothetical protein [Desulfofundulus australicus]SHF64954.1 hypothetical protein SAMN02745218_02792 [Desulfofundulus australicus DSM 11792]